MCIDVTGLMSLTKATAVMIFITISLSKCINRNKKDTFFFINKYSHIHDVRTFMIFIISNISRACTNRIVISINLLLLLGYPVIHTFTAMNMEI